MRPAGCVPQWRGYGVAGMAEERFSAKMPLDCMTLTSSLCSRHVEGKEIEN